jgi:hypothetical protein
LLKMMQGGAGVQHEVGAESAILTENPRDQEAANGRFGKRLPDCHLKLGYTRTCSAE